MKQARLSMTLALLSVAVLAGCSGGITTTPPAPNTVPVSVTITDAPPAGVTILSFQVTLTSAVLNPGNVSLISSPIRTDVNRLEADTGLLDTFNVAEGTYSSITLAFANPAVVFKNDAGPSVPGCTPDPLTFVCEITPAVAGNVTFSGAPFPLTLTAGSPTGLLLDIDLSRIITSTMGINFSAPGGVMVSQLPLPGGPADQLSAIENLTGTVTARDATNNQFTLQATQGTYTIGVDSSTQFIDFNQAIPPCTPQTFSCLSVGQTVKVEAVLLPGGALRARSVAFQDDLNRQNVEGIVARIESPTQFALVLVDSIPAGTGLAIGTQVRVNLQAGAAFAVDRNGLAIPTDLSSSFLTSADLLVGQNVHVRRLASSFGAVINTDRVRLQTARATGTVSAILNPTDYTVNNLPSVFTALEVRTSAQTVFEPFGTTAGSLTVRSRVSQRGLVFRRAVGNPVLVAKKARRRF